jgi:hypothetical protein
MALLCQACQSLAYALTSNKNYRKYLNGRINHRNTHQQHIGFITPLDNVSTRWRHTTLSPLCLDPCHHQNNNRTRLYRKYHYQTHPRPLKVFTKPIQIVRDLFLTRGYPL